MHEESCRNPKQNINKLNSEKLFTRETSAKAVYSSTIEVRPSLSEPAERASWNWGEKHLFPLPSNDKLNMCQHAEKTPLKGPSSLSQSR